MEGGGGEGGDDEEKCARMTERLSFTWRSIRRKAVNFSLAQ